MPLQDASIRKRTQIAKANRVMFLWVAGASALIGASLVGIMFLTQILFFNERVLSEKGKTLTTLNENINVVDELNKQVRLLDTNQALLDSRATPDDKAIQVILDALPSSANSLALGASLQNKLLANISGLTIDTLQVDSVVGVESLSSDASVENASPDSTNMQNEITFRFSVSGSETALKQALLNLEKSIRTIDIISLKIEGQGVTTIMTIQARAFYESARTVELMEKTVK